MKPNITKPKKQRGAVSFQKGKVSGYHSKNKSLKDLRPAERDILEMLPFSLADDQITVHSSFMHTLDFLHREKFLTKRVIREKQFFNVVENGKKSRRFKWVNVLEVKAASEAAKPQPTTVRYKIAS